MELYIFLVTLWNLWHIAFLVSGISGAGRPEWYVSWKGTNRRDCGHSHEDPCRTFSQIFAKSQGTPSYTIFVDGSRGIHEKDNFYEVCKDNRYGQIIPGKQVDIRGYGGIPKIGCSKHAGNNTIWKFYGKSVIHSRLDLKGVSLQDGHIFISNVSVSVANTQFWNATIKSLPNCLSMSFTGENTTFFRRELCNKTENCHMKDDVFFMCENMNVVLKKSKFWDIRMWLRVRYFARIEISSTIFSRKLQGETGYPGGIHASIPLGNSSVVIDKSIFENQRHSDPILSAINIEEASLRIETHRPPGPINKRGATIHITNSIFRNNERAISISSPFKGIVIENCTLRNNRVMHAAPAIRLATDNKTKIEIRSSTFEGNYAGYNMHGKSSTMRGYFEVDGDQVRVNSKKYNGVVSLVGKGGAIRIAKGTTYLLNCTFRNNTARLLGGSVCVDRNSSLIIDNSRFENSYLDHPTMQGDILYSSGKVKIKSTTFNVKTAKDYVAVLRHSGEHWSMDVESLTFRCPEGHRLLLVNSSSHKIEQKRGLLRSHKLDQLSYFCQTCGSNQYSVDHGYLNYTLTNNATEYFTLLINGEQPFQTHSVSYTYGNITCRDCPYGGTCENGIRAVPNFWGYNMNQEVVFQHCPQDYCCTNTKCPRVDTCAPYRVGRLCGRCQAGYSEALFSPLCVPNHTCQQIWLLPFSMSIGFLYALFLYFQRDLKDLIFTWTTHKQRFSCHIRKPYFVAFVQRKTRGRDRVLVNSSEATPLSQLESQRAGDDASTKGQSSECGEADPDQPDQSAGFLIIMFYYFQDALLLHVDTVYTKTVSKVEKQLKSLLVGLFRFRLDFYSFLDNVCLFPDLTAVPKLLLKTLFVPYTLVLFGVFYVVLKVVCILKKHRRKPVVIKGSAHKEEVRSWSTRLSGGFILALLFTYQKMATAIFGLLNCVPVGNESVLFMDGNTTCFAPWQYGVMAYAFSCVLPFSVVLMVGPPLLRNGHITLFEFFCGCLFPLPALTVWAIKWNRKIFVLKDNGKTENATPETITVLDILEGPFKTATNKHMFGQLCWAGVLIGRRLILFLCFTFINDVLVRLLCMLAVCFVILMHHVYVQPYKAARGNMAGALSAGALLVVGGINLVRSGFEAAEYIPIGPNKFLMEVMEEIENILVLWLPLGGMCLIILVLIVRIAMILASALLKNHRNRTENDETPTVETRVVT